MHFRLLDDNYFFGYHTNECSLVDHRREYSMARRKIPLTAPTYSLTPKQHLEKSYYSSVDDLAARGCGSNGKNLSPYYFLYAGSIHRAGLFRFAPVRPSTHERDSRQMRSPLWSIWTVFWISYSNQGIIRIKRRSSVCGSGLFSNKPHLIVRSYGS